MGMMGKYLATIISLVVTIFFKLRLRSTLEIEGLGLDGHWPSQYGAGLSDYTELSNKQ